MQQVIEDEREPWLSGLGQVSSISRQRPNRRELIRSHALAMIERGEQVTITAIREFLRSLDQGYSLKTDQISFALTGLRNAGKVEKWPNGKRVMIGQTIYRSIRQAAEARGCAINTVRKRISSKNPKFRYWRYVDD